MPLAHRHSDNDSSDPTTGLGFLIILIACTLGIFFTIAVCNHNYEKSKDIAYIDASTGIMVECRINKKHYRGDTYLCKMRYKEGMAKEIISKNKALIKTKTTNKPSFNSSPLYMSHTAY